MPLKAKIQSLEEVEEALHSLYRQLPDDGGYVLDVIEVDGYAMENIAGLRNTLQTQKSAIQSSKDKLDMWGDLEPETVRKSLNKLKELEQLDPEALAQERVQSAVSSQKQQFETALAGKESEIKELNSVIEGLMIDSVATAALAEAKGEAKLLLPHIKSQCKVARTDHGKRVVQVLDHNGNARIAIQDGQTRDFTINDLIAEMREDTTFGRAFETKAKGGTGGPSDHPREPSGGKRTLADAGHETISSNLEDIASGKAEVAAL